METITIIGTGLIGCSLGLALRKQGYFVIGCDKNMINLEQAKAIGAIDTHSQTCQPPNLSISQSSVVFLATPVDHILDMLPQVLDNLANDGTVIDTGSTKSAICESVLKHPRRHAFIAAHPMAGSEQSGPSTSRANLFEGKTVAICERELSSESSLSKALGILSQVGLNPIFLTPIQHDSSVALVSHLPQILAYAFAGLPEFTQRTNQHWSQVASSGFDSSTRLAASTPQVWLPILSQNKKFIIDALGSLNRTIGLLADGLNDNNAISLQTLMESAYKTRAMFESKQRNISVEIKTESLTK